MLRFSSRVRRSLAAQFIKLSWTGSAVFGFFGWMEGVSAIVVVAIITWWFAFQIFGHVILAYEDASDRDSKDDSS